MSMSNTTETQSDHVERHIWLEERDESNDLLFTNNKRDHLAQPTQLPINISLATPEYLIKIKQKRVINFNINCPALFAGDTENVSSAHDYMYKNPRAQLTAFDYLTMADNCQVFRDERGYVMHPTSKDEVDFPIAFSILMYTGVQQVERLLRAVYAPQNFYCIHIDLKATDEVHMAMRAISR